MELSHKGCRGRLNLDLSSIISVKTRSTSLTEIGISLGVLEISTKESKSGTKFCCSKCEQEILLTDVENITAKCPICRKEKSIDQIMFSDVFPVLCDKCCRVLSGEEPVTSNLIEVASFFSGMGKISGRPAVELLSNIKI